MRQLLSIVGGFTLAKLTYDAFKVLYQFVFHRSQFARYISQDPKSPTWALVTGATHGIGLAFARELCGRGANVVLHGRNENKLERVKGELLSQYPDRLVHIWVADAAEDASSSIRETAEAMLRLPEGGKLRILVNNVGATNPGGAARFVALQEMSLEAIETLLSVNVRFPAQLTAALMSTLSANGPSLVVNLGSMAGISCVPFLSIYASTKAFDHAFSRSLAAEIGAMGSDVEVIGIPVGSVATSDEPGEDKGAFSVGADQFVRGALDSVGCGQNFLHAHWKHLVFAAMSGLMPKTVISNKLRDKWIAEKKGI